MSDEAVMDERFRAGFDAKILSGRATTRGAWNSCWFGGGFTDSLSVKAAKPRNPDGNDSYLIGEYQSRASHQSVAVGVSVGRSKSDVLYLSCSSPQSLPHLPITRPERAESGLGTVSLSVPLSPCRAGNPHLVKVSRTSMQAFGPKRLAAHPAAMSIPSVGMTKWRREIIPRTDRKKNSIEVSGTSSSVIKRTPSAKRCLRLNTGIIQFQNVRSSIVSDDSLPAS
ncbi:hypothetical protein MYCTH_90598 [Thermothelomyces thermophilus ATCC 42464]|uniref:Uncharacterized protein n=1 Tax=Thermothelomyces thermophilus (strain ATCC 42464 / BCRC 31852 / DSM 1799) TaxID=573729 RepID=G2QMM6_THET4|nr:uncharacterized protein MYCTH_90598 [Thermothelomyces thermophilus ATCC 42464]AEO61206.1 hypothetical protein MYCTH_90598 [Thermothelomyces thermophilus ATCC 42464]